MKNSRTDPELRAFGPRPLAEYWQLSRRIFAAAARGKPIRGYLQDVAEALYQFTQADELELWIQSRLHQLRLLRWRTENSESGEPGYAWLPLAACPPSGFERVCAELLAGKGPAALFESTDRGSVVIRDTGRLPVSLAEGLVPFGPDAVPDGPDRSLLLLPFAGWSEDPSSERGLVVLRYRRPVPFTDEEVDLLEEVAENLGLALNNRRTHASLRERVKELTCLYQIALLVEQPRASLDDILQGIVEVLPTAWLYPEDAWAYLAVDGRTYQTRIVSEHWSRLTSEIMVGGVSRGRLEAGYSVTKPVLHEGPFLKEERHLLETVAREVALVIERRDIEDKSRQLQQQLIHAERLATIGELSSGVAHELNEPLNNILGFAQLAQKCPDLPPQAAQDLQKIVISALHTRQVIQQLLLFSRRMPQRRTLLDLNQAVEESYSFLQALCAKTRIDLVRRLEAGLPPISADPDQIRQVVVNLVVNGAQSMPAGGTLTVSTRLSEDGGSACLVVEDTGTGIETENLDRIFLPFFTTRETGTGLGLSVVHGIVSSHGGSIQVNSKPGDGTRFEVRLPLNPSSPSEMDTEGT